MKSDICSMGYYYSNPNAAGEGGSADHSNAWSHWKSLNRLWQEWSAWEVDRPRMWQRGMVGAGGQLVFVGAPSVEPLQLERSGTKYKPKSNAKMPRGF